MEWCGYDAVRVDGEERSVGVIDRVAIIHIAISSSMDETFV